MKRARIISSFILPVAVVSMLSLSDRVSVAEPGPIVSQAVTIKFGERHESHFDAPPTPPGQEAVLVVSARLDHPKAAGYNPAMRVWLNGKPLGGKRLLDRPLTMPRVDGNTQSASRGDHLTVPYAPDFEATDAHVSYALIDVKACRFALRVTDLLKKESNVLVFENRALGGVRNVLAVSETRLEFRDPVARRVKSGPPEGALPIYIPASTFKVDYVIARRSDGELDLTLGDETFRITSEFSTPDGKWRKSSNRYFSIERRIEKRDEAIIVRDTFTNRTDQNLPLMQRHRIPLKLKQVWLAGLSPVSKRGAAANPANPTVFGVMDGSVPRGGRQTGIGLMAWDDVFQVHVNVVSDGKSLGLEDRNLVLPPGTTHTAEWAIVPIQTSGFRRDGTTGGGGQPEADGTDSGDNEAYFSFVNAARRLRNVNFTIDGGFAFLRSDPRHVGKWSDEKVATFIRNKTAKYLCISIDYPRYHGHYPHGTAFQTIAFDAWKREIARRRLLVPDAKHIAYFHCFIDVLDGADKKYADARLLGSDGVQPVYGRPIDKLFFPTDTNSYGRDVAKNVEMILGDIGCDGVYWDEMEYSRYRYHYGEPWDGVSADIDPTANTIRKLKSSVTLLSQPWRLALANKIISRGPLIANGAPHTRSMAKLHFPRFVETGSISHCTGAQLYTPIALGDHLTEHNEIDAYRVMLRALDYGCVYYWYNDLTVIPTHPHLTEFMFPISPLELHEGFIIGAGRIITNRSGLFGWGDKTEHEIHVFDAEGRPVRDFSAPTVVRDGATFTELRIAEDWSAAILAKPSVRAGVGD